MVVLFWGTLYFADSISQLTGISTIQSYIILRLENEFKAKVETEKDEEKQKLYYSSKDYQKLEKKKSKVGIVKKKKVSHTISLILLFSDKPKFFEKNFSW